MRYIVFAALFLAMGSATAIIFQARQRAIVVKPAKERVFAIEADLARRVVPHKSRTSMPESKPNIVIILADDLGWRDVGYNFSEIRTPNIDRLARDGIRLNRFYVQPTCSPTRAALLTGKAPLRLGVLNPLSKNNLRGLPIDEKTLADYLKATGYQTALVGKRHHGARDLAYHPNARGFDHFYGNLTGGVGYYDKVHGGGYDWQRNGVTLREEGYTTRLIAKEAARLIVKRDPVKSLFLYVSFGAPHLPNEAPSDVIGSYAFIKDVNRRTHAAMVTELDSAIGEIYAAIAAEGIEDETLLLFMSDNGGTRGNALFRFLPGPLFEAAVEAKMGVEVSSRFLEFARENLTEGGADNRPFRGGKQTVDEGGVRVPAFIHWRSQFEPGDFNYMATVQDVAPTLLEVAGASVEELVFDGRSLWTAFNTNTPGTPMKYIVHADQVVPATAVYQYPYKFVTRGGRQSLFNIESDPLERRNIAREHPVLVEELSHFLAAFPRGEDVSIDLWDIVRDPDFFGGEEDRPPWAEQATSTN